MTYHVVCPLSKKRYDFDTPQETRWFAIKILNHIPGVKTRRIRIYDGKKLMGSAWRDSGMIWYQSVGVRAKRIVANDGSFVMRK